MLYHRLTMERADNVAAPAADPAEPMKPRRVWLVYGVIAVLVLPHLHEIARQQEHWPFSNYPMWATATRDWHVANVVPLGVTDENPPQEEKLTDPQYLAPLPLYYQRLTFQKAARRERMREAVARDYLAEYERRRTDGKHFGPPLKAIRLYEWYWTMQPDAANAKAPDRRTLLYEYPPPAKGAGS